MYRSFVTTLLIVMLVGTTQVPGAKSTVAFPTTRAIGGSIVPASLGVNVHFTHPQPGELHMLARAGFQRIRMDLFWQKTEQRKRHYDFSNYDYLLSRLKPYHMRAWFILDWTNQLYQHGQPPTTPTARKAFCRWVSAAVTHFAGKGIIWELWSEPNANFWSDIGGKHIVDAQGYAQLAVAVGKAIRRVNPKAYYVGPGLLGTMNRPFLAACFKAGALNYWNAVTIHPYRKGRPETVVKAYARLRRMIAQYVPAGRKVPIISGEWGYSTNWLSGKQSIQARYTAREFLINLSQQIPITIYYDWRNDGTNPKDREDHFGLVGYQYQSNGYNVFHPKPAYLAVKTLATQLRGCQFIRRRSVGNPNDYCLMFAGPHRRCMVAWTISPTQPHKLAIPMPAGVYRLTNDTGLKSHVQTTVHGVLHLYVSHDPQYVVLTHKSPDRTTK